MECGEARAGGMVLVCDGRSEERHDAVPRELVHRPLETAHAVGQQLEEALHDLAPLVRVDLLRHVHRALDVGEEDCHLLALPVELALPGGDYRFGRLRDQGGAAGIAERLAGWVLRTALRAGKGGGQACAAAATEA